MNDIDAIRKRWVDEHGNMIPAQEQTGSAPDTILRLCDEVERLRAELRQQSERVEILKEQNDWLDKQWAKSKAAEPKP